MSITPHPRRAIGLLLAAAPKMHKGRRRGASVARILRPSAKGPVFDFVRKIRPRLMGEIFCDVDSVLLRKETALSLREIRPVRDRHVGFDEGGGRVGARHPR